MRKKVVFLGSKPIGYHCLAYMIAQQESLNIEVVAVLTQSRKEFGGANDLNELAQQNNIPTLNSPDDIPECDILYSVQYHQILKQQHIDKAKTIALNLHMAPLPEYRGANQFSFAILEDKEEFGTTIHQVDSRIDHGAILFQRRFPIPDNCWVNELYELTYEHSLKLFKSTLANIMAGQYDLVPQQVLEAKYGTSLHYKNEISTLKQIDLDWESDKIQKHIRATYMPGFEPPYCIINGEKIYFSRQA